MKKEKPKQHRGFRAMKEKTKLRICSMGGTAVSRIPGHMARIGRKGGKANKGRSRKLAAVA